MRILPKLKITLAYVLLGCPIGTLLMVIGVNLLDPKPSGGPLDVQFIVEALEVFLAGYAFGFFPALSSGAAHLYARAHAFSRNQTIGLVSAVGATASVVFFALGFPQILQRPSSAALVIVVGLVPAAFISVLLTRFDYTGIKLT